MCVCTYIYTHTHTYNFLYYIMLFKKLLQFLKVKSKTVRSIIRVSFGPQVQLVKQENWDLAQQ